MAGGTTAAEVVGEIAGMALTARGQSRPGS